MYHPAGVYPAIPTPFKRNGDLDETGLRDLVAHYENMGVNGLLIMGTIGEFAMMSEHERKKAADIAMGTTERLEMVINAGCASTRETIRMARYLKDLGVDAIIAVEPYFYHPSPEGLAKHYLTIAEETDMPVLAYNIPQFAGNRLMPEALGAFAKDDRIVGLKDSEGDPMKLMEFIRQAPRDFSVMVGADPLVSYGLSMGAKGMMVGSASVAPEACINMYRAVVEKDLGKAFIQQKALNDYIRAMCVGTFPASIKYMLTLRGLPGGHVRPPLEELAAGQKRVVDGCIGVAKVAKEVVL